ncbi:MAG: hypothetical protein C0596_15300 [Marinilabiliales bacterium]|nr:MAG: hypothetical protein C0596_15300 [Marinilabiliales bacterium]
MRKFFYNIYQTFSVRILLFLIVSQFSFSLFSQTNHLISTGVTVYVDSGDKFYDAGGPSGDDGNTSYTMTMCPSTPGEKVAVDFNYFVSTWDSMWDDEDRLVIYDGPTATGQDIGDLKGDYTIKYNTGVTPHGMGVEAFNSFPLIGTPTIFSATNSTGCLTFEFINGYSEQNAGWEAEILTYTSIDEPGCNIGITASDDSICIGDPVTLTANGTVSNSPINNDFNSGSIGTGWSATSSASFVNNACGYPSLDGSLYLWMQNAAGPRGLVTNVMDASMGGSISFEYRQAINNGNASPCESPDQGSGTFEGIYLQYSTDGTNWTTFKYIYPNGTEGSFGAEMGLTGCGNYVKRWTKMTYPIPVAAQSTTTQFRWVQAKVTSSSTDNWGLDNVVIAIPTGSYTVSIEDLSTSTILASQVDGEATCVVNPSSTTTYRATVDDGSSSCFEDITVYVADPFVLSCGTSTATSVGFVWTVANGATSYDYSYSVDGAPAVSGNTSANTLSVGPVTSGSNVELTVTPVSSICTDPQTIICTTTGCVSPVADAGSHITIDCNTPSINLDGSASSTGVDFTYLWSTADGNIVSGADTQTPVIDLGGTYTLTVTNNNGGCIATDNVVVTGDFATPTAGITNNTGTTVLDCTNTSISVTATGGGTYSWSGGSTPGTANNTLTSAGNYTVTVTGTNGCTDTESINITQNATPPTAGITNNTGTTILDCNTTSISVTAAGGGTYSWSGGATPGTSGNTLNSAGNYTVTVTAVNGCTYTESINITQNITPPSAGITNNTGTTVLDCNNTSISVTATGGGTYSWSGGASPVSASNTFNTAGNYTVSVTGANGCTDSESINITQDISSPTVNITNNTGTTVLDCSTTAINVTASGGVSYSWSGGSTPGMSTNTFTSPSNYLVTVTGTNGCTNTSSINITQNISAPSAGITNNTGTTDLTCIITSISVTAIGGVSYLWSGGSNTTSANNTLTSPGAYTVSVTGSNGCTDTEVINITQSVTPPVASITNNTGNSELDCNNTFISLTAGGGGTYSWSGGSSTTMANNVITSPGLYTVTVSLVNGCTDSEVINISQNINAPTAGIINTTGSDILTCNLTSIDVLATGGGTYVWSGGSSLNSANNTFNTPGNYTVTVTGSNGCTDTESVNISQNIIVPTAGITNLSGTTILTCLDNSIDLMATGGGTYLWSGGTSPSLSTNTINSPGNYTVTVT